MAMERPSSMKISSGTLNIALVCLLIILPTGHIGAVETLPLPKAVVEQPSHQFSPVIAGAEIVHHFTLGNQGEAALNIVGVQSG